MANTQTTVAPPIFPGRQQPFASWLFGGLTQGENGEWTLSGMPAYPGALYPSLNSTMLPSVYGAWSPQDPGQTALLSLLSQGMPMQLQNNLASVYQYGGAPGWPLDLMHSMAQYGGAGQPANFMSNVMQWGAPTQATGRPMQQIANTGGTGTWGDLLQQYALGGGPGMQFLAPYIGAKPYTAPQMPMPGGR